MAFVLGNQLLLAIAAVADDHRRLTTLSLVGAISGDPRLYRNRRWMQRYLRDRRKRQQLQKAWHELKRQGYLQEKVLGTSRGYLVTPKGEIKVFHLRSQADAWPKRRRLPSGHYLLVLFDVPETLRKKRDLFRRELRGLGFEPLQKSVWVTQCRVQDELRELIALLDFRQYARSLLVEEIGE